MELVAQDIKDARVLRVEASRIDAAVAIQFKDRFRDLVQGVDGRIVLDLSQVDFLDSSGLGAVVAAMKLLGGGRRLELAGLTPTVHKVFRLTRMEQVFIIHDQLEEIVDSPSRVNGG